jgi:hypothetical protein
MKDYILEKIKTKIKMIKKYILNSIPTGGDVRIVVVGGPKLDGKNSIFEYDRFQISHWTLHMWVNFIVIK